MIAVARSRYALDYVEVQDEEIYLTDMLSHNIEKCIQIYLKKTKV